MTKEEFQSQYMAHLNPQQAAAVSAVDGPTLLLAVPGSGKTTVLVIRLGYMTLCCGIPPENILTMTYTVAATNEMRQRFGNMFGKELANRMEFRTINGLSAKIIDYYSKHFGKGAVFTLLENEGQKAQILSRIYQKLTQEYPTVSTIKDIQTGITYVKNMMLSDEEIEKADTGVKDFPLIYQQYVKAMVGQRLMDYDDQMAYALKILQGYPAVLQYFQDRFPYLCVDESQDTSKIQHAIIQLLAQKSKNIFMVGDEDQSIYGFRAAYPDALMKFEQQYPNAKVLLMEENYRSTPEIIHPANVFVSKNRYRHQKAMKATQDNGKPVQIIYTVNRQAQYKYLFAEAKISKQKMAVLFRNNDSSLPLVDMFEREGIPYNIRKFEEAFFSNRITADIVDIITLAFHPNDKELFMRTYYKFGCPISKKAALLACEKSRSSGKPIFEELLTLPEIKGYVRDSVIDLVSMLPQLQEDSAETALNRVWHGMRYRSYAEAKKLDTRKFDILILLSRNESSAKGLLRRIQELKGILQNHKNTSSAQILLSSIHSSKGLEYDRVFILDVIDDIFPAVTAASAKSKEEIQKYEEERRLFYVAMTRAKKELCLFICENTLSSFTDEVSKSLPKPQIEEGDIFSFLQRNLCGYTYADKEKGKGTIIAHCGEMLLAEFDDKSFQLFSIDEMFRNRDKTIHYAPPATESNATESDAVDTVVNMFSVVPGNRVVHSRFGEGTVMGCDGTLIFVQFDTEKDMKKFDLKMVREKKFMWLLT